MSLRHIVRPDEAGLAVLTVLRRSMGLSASMIRRLKFIGGICVNGVPVYTNHPVRAGDTVEARTELGEPPSGIVPERGPVAVLFENMSLIAVHKPAGLLTHPSRAKHTGTLANFVADYLGRTSGGACHAVNRLDRDTSGIVLFAKSAHFKALAGRALLAEDAKREYLAAVCGTVIPASGVIDLPIRRVRPGDMLRAVLPDGQRAVTAYETVGTLGGGQAALLRLRLFTGRTHQIRVHCCHLGHPILGDGLYKTAASERLSAEMGFLRQALHAARLAFTDPVSGAYIEITSGPPDDLPGAFVPDSTGAEA